MSIIIVYDSAAFSFLSCKKKNHAQFFNKFFSFSFFPPFLEEGGFIRPLGVERFSQTAYTARST